jgi:hypothetical protein
MKTKIKATTSFMHGRIHAHAGDELEVSKGEADDLVKAGMAEVAAEAQAEEQTAAPVAPDDGVDDLLGDAKMEDAPQNKMEAEPDNKAGGKKTTTAKK